MNCSGYAGFWSAREIKVWEASAAPASSAAGSQLLPNPAFPPAGQHACRKGSAVELGLFCGYIADISGCHISHLLGRPVHIAIYWTHSASYIPLKMYGNSSNKDIRLARIFFSFPLNMQFYWERTVDCVASYHNQLQCLLFSNLISYVTIYHLKIFTLSFSIQNLTATGSLAKPRSEIYRDAIYLTCSAGLYISQYIGGTQRV